MNPMNARCPRLILAAMLLAAACPSLAAPRFPTPPLPERAFVLHRESFDELYRSRMTNALLSVPGFGELRESWSGYALQRAGDTLAPFIIPGTDAEGNPLLGSSSGSVRFWFRSYWARPSKHAAVSGPGAGARLLAMAAIAPDGQAVTCWSLDAAPDGSALILSVQDNNGCREVLQARINWGSGETHLLTLNYSPEATTLYLDDRLAAEGKGIIPLPAAAAAMVIGSALDGRNPAQGEVDELFLLGRPLDAEQIGFYYQGTWKQAFLGPVGTREEERAKQELLALELELLAFESGSLMWLDGGDDLDDPQDFDDPLVYSEGSLHLEITGTTNNLAHVIIHGTVPDTTYELLSKTDLTNSPWLSEGLVLGAVDQTNTPAVINMGTRTNQLFLWARSWADGDGNGLPDWWELDYFGLTGQDGYGDPDGDGWTNIQEYQNGTHPRVFNSPPPPRNVLARLDSTGANVILTWESGGAAAASYEIHNTADGTVQTNSGNTFAFTNTMPPFSTLMDARLRPYYWVRAIFTNPVSAMADSSLVGVLRRDLAADVRIVRGSQGRCYLIMGAAPSELHHVLLEWDSPVWTRTQMVIYATNLVNGIVEIPSEVVATTGEIYYQLFNATGTPGDVGSCWGHSAIADEHSWSNDSTLDYADVRPHMKENLKFLLRSATITRPFSYAANRRTDGGWLWWEAFPEEINQPKTYYARPPSSTAYEYSGFRYFSPNYDYSVAGELRPLIENYYWRNFMVNAADLAITNIPWQAGFGEDNPYATRALNTPSCDYSGSGQESPLPLPLSNSIPSFLYYQWFGSGFYYDFDAAADVGVVLNTVGTTNLMLQTGVSNCYGLRLVSILNSDGEVAFPGDPLPLWWDMQYYPNFEIPELQTVDYYFASQTPFFQYNWDSGTPRPPLPGSPDFTVTNTSPLMIASFAQPMAVASWARQKIVNGYEGKFAYLEQLFDHALTIGPNATVTTNSAGTLSPYGEFFPTVPGPAALVTMPDLDTGQRGTGIVHAVKLQLDVNHDGAMDLSFAGPDNTSQGRPALMWINNDHDEPASGKQPDRDLNDWGNPPPVPLDYSYGQIRCQRNMEDFARLWISGVPALPTNQSYSVQLAWSQISSGAPRMRLYWASETNGGIGYLTNTATAAQQIAHDNLPIGEISPTSTLTLPANVFSNGLTKHFLFEAGAVGSGQLTLTISQGGTTTIAQTSAWFDFRDIEHLCEWALVTNVLQDWPDMVQTNLTSGFQVLSHAKVNPGEAKQQAVFIHGWRMGMWDWFNFSSTMFKRLWWQGYQGRFATLRWPTRSGETELFPAMGYITYNRSEHVAFKSGTGAAAYLIDLRNRFSDYTISGCAHSMGGIVTMETLKQLASVGQQPMDNWVLMQAAVPAHCFDPNVPSYQLFLNGEAVAPTPDTYRSYAAGITNALRPGGRISNFFNTNDFALSTWEINQSFYNANFLGYGVATMKPNSFVGYSSDGTTSLLSTNAWNLSFWSAIYGGYYLNGPTRAVTNGLELMPFVARPRSLAVGAQPGVHGQVLREINLSALGFSSSPGDHSGQFNRNVQELPVWPFYTQLKTNLFLQQ